MDWKNPKSVETKIARLLRELGQIDELFYYTNETKDRMLYAGMLERKRDDMVRAAVLQMHTAIGDILNTAIIARILTVKPEDRGRKMRGTTAGKALHKVLFGAGSIGFDMKLNLALSLRLLDTTTKNRLMELNTLRNKCSHNWLLKSPVRRGKRPAQKKLPLLLYQGRDLHTVTVLKEFTDEFATIYAKMFLKHL